MMYKVLLLGLLLSFHSVFAQEKVELVVIDSEISDALVGANVVVIETGEVYATDLEGKLVFDLIPGMSLSLSISVVGYDTQVIKISSSKNRVIVRMVPTLVDLDEVVVTTKAVDANVKSTNLGRNVLEIESIRELPPLAGEVDVIKSLVLLPGVSTVGEASSGFNVRGGGLDQNLILLGGGVLYNPSHLFGFFSSITPEVIDGVVLFKGVVPPKYGGRASSVLDIGLKTGDYKKWGGSLGVGFVSSKASLSGPIIEDKLALTLGGRVSYVNWLLNSFNSDEVQRSNANFNDISGKLDYFINDNNQLSYSFYNSTDDFNLASDTTNEWSNQSHVIKWDHFFSDRLSSTVTGSYNKYAFGILNESGINDFTLESSIIDQSVKLDLDYKLSDKYNINFGAEGRSYLIDPGTFELKNDVDAENLDIEDEQGVEVAAFLYNEVDIGEKLRISAGARYVDYRYLGEKTVSVYDDIFPKSNATRIDQISYGAGETITSFARLEPRFGVRYTINESTSVKAGYNRMNQFINLISNTASISPVNIWKLSDTHVNPQSSQQLSLGVFKNFNNNS
ncbi:MAG: TonB-dependent receptor, partial [Ekhidna sp.]|nr:TonB-dependent receptor [Ekhidna sp.]